MERLPLETQTLYAELLEQLAALEARRSIGSLPGCFTRKTVKGADYWYYQQSLPGGGQRQVYLGKRGPLLDSVVERFESGREEHRGDAARVERLCSLLRVGGALSLDPASARVLRALAEAGVFRLGGVLVGTNAFLVLGNLLGARWRRGAAESRLGIAIEGEGADLPATLERLEMGFSPIPPLDHRNPSTSWSVRGRSLRLDLVTPERSPRSSAPVPIPRLKGAAQPLRFLDFLMGEVEKGALIDGGGVLVNVPSPARFALHKLILAGERGVAGTTKAGKDLLQAAQVAAVLAGDRPGDLPLAWEEIRRRGPGWVKRVRAGVARLKAAHPREWEILQEVVG